jgi:SAM-dependent methyltransferase
VTGGAAGPGRVLTAEEFREAAAGRRAVVTERSTSLVREDQLPPDWLATTVACYSTESGYYELAQYADVQPMKATIDGLVADAVARTAAGAVLDVGVGDGHRLARIGALVADRCGRVPRLHGVELSEPMAERARARGVSVVVHDMRRGIPDVGCALDAVLFLSGDLGYLMDPVAGAALRSRVLDSAHERLAPGGVVVLELVSRDPRLAPGGADVFHFSRTPVVHGDDGRELFRGPETWQHVKSFSRAEVVALLESSRFDATAATLRYVVRDSADVQRIGLLVEDGEIRPDESYRLLAVLTA